ncbi:putative metalloprotease CJM1_0395 family protein [Gynuella sp.]|uniref:putative metalloprotease CJM1_0395 family protein n=1 Tax=Gynuella sp. TaxID=2969146 RepID=UPI003D0E7216
MSVVTGASLNSVHLAVPAAGPVVPINIDNDKTSFAPITETEEADKGRNRAGEQPSRDADRQVQAKSDKQQDNQKDAEQDDADLQAEQQKLRVLKQRDREVKDHEQAHRAVGGKHAGPMTLTYERGPDGVNYAVAGEVQINVSKVSDDPEATIVKAEQIRRAALAPATPSQQDRSVALQATQMIVEAEQLLRQQKVSESTSSEPVENQQNTDDDDKSVETSGSDLTETFQGLFKSPRKFNEPLGSVGNYQQKTSGLGNNLDLMI